LYRRVGVSGKSARSYGKKGDGTRKRDEGARGRRGKAAERGRFYRRNQGQRAKGKAMPPLAFPLVSLALRYATPLRQVYGRRCTDVLSSLTVYQPSSSSSPRLFLSAASTFRHFISLGIFSSEHYRLPEAVTRARSRLDSAHPSNRGFSICRIESSVTRDSSATDKCPSSRNTDASI